MACVLASIAGSGFAEDFANGDDQTVALPLTTPKPKAYQPSDLQRLRSSPLIEGGKVSVIGQLGHLDEKQRAQLLGSDGPAVTVLKRQVMVCCAKDTLSVYAIIDGDVPKDLKDGAWVTVDGEADARGDSATVPVISIQTVEEMPAPKHPYLMPQVGKAAVP